jgi:hypothetical protein
MYTLVHVKQPTIYHASTINRTRYKQYAQKRDPDFKMKLSFTILTIGKFVTSVPMPGSDTDVVGGITSGKQFMPQGMNQMGGQGFNPYAQLGQGGGQGFNPYAQLGQGGGQGFNPYSQLAQGGQGFNPYSQLTQGGGQFQNNGIQSPYASLGLPSNLQNNGFTQPGYGSPSGLNGFPQSVYGASPGLQVGSPYQNGGQGYQALQNPQSLYGGSPGFQGGYPYQNIGQGYQSLQNNIPQTNQMFPQGAF